MNHLDAPLLSQPFQGWQTGKGASGFCPVLGVDFELPIGFALLSEEVLPLVAKGNQALVTHPARYINVGVQLLLDDAPFDSDAQEDFV